MPPNETGYLNRNWSAPPLLQQVPDGRLAPAPLFEPVFFGYAMLVAGGAITGLCAAYNAALLRRWRLFAESLAIGGGAWLGFYLLASLLHNLGIGNVPMVLLLARAVTLGFGILLAARHWPHARGHQLRGGKTIPVLWSLVAALALFMMARGELLIWMLGYPWGGLR